MRISILLTLTITFSLAGMAETVIPVGPFDSIELHDGGRVLIRQGSPQRVTLVSGDVRATRIAVQRDRLIIENRGPHRRDEPLVIEVVTPELNAVSISNGGTLQTTGAFAPQSSIAASVEQGGIIDIRSIAADAVTAAVEQGGRIFTHARQSLTAAVRSGGSITYWGNPQVTEAVHRGGVVAKGKQADVAKPLSELAGHFAINPPKPPAPPAPPAPPRPPSRH